MARQLEELGWSEADLQTRPKNDPAKLAPAARLRRETILTTKEIAARLSLGTAKSATTALHRWMRDHPPATGAPFVNRQLRPEARTPRREATKSTS